jgi:hypothetical protein
MEGRPIVDHKAKKAKGKIHITKRGKSPLREERAKVINDQQLILLLNKGMLFSYILLNMKKVLVQFVGRK